MELPLETQQLCEQFLKKVRQDPEHCLTATERLQIYKTFGPSKIEGYSFPDDVEAAFWELSFADYAINWLAVITAEHVLPVCDAGYQNLLPKNHHEDDVLPNDILQVAKEVLERKIEIKKVTEDYYEIYYYSSSGFEKLIHYNVFCVYGAAESALLQVLFGEQIFNNTPIDRKDFREFGRATDFTRMTENAYSLTDTNPPGQWKTFIGSFIPISGFEIDTQKRLEFWEWWLTEAIPQAWELANRTYTKLRP